MENAFPDTKRKKAVACRPPGGSFSCCCERLIPVWPHKLAPGPSSPTCTLPLAAPIASSPRWSHWTMSRGHRSPRGAGGTQIPPVGRCSCCSDGEVRIHKAPPPRLKVESALWCSSHHLPPPWGQLIADSSWGHLLPGSPHPLSVGTTPPHHSNPNPCLGLCFWGPQLRTTPMPHSGESHRHRTF